MSQKSRAGPCSGFTLLEIMIALAIISIAMIALLGLTNRSISVHDRLQRVTEATLLAQKMMAETEIKAESGTLNRQDAEGVFEAPNEAYRWQIAFRDTPLPSVEMVTVTVLWGDEENREFVDIASFVF
ncbi:MAG: prepilin-type N-terminal cleavage/methylation domain-containing protein [Desulfuromonadales bacterium]